VLSRKHLRLGMGRIRRKTDDSARIPSIHRKYVRIAFAEYSGNAFLLEASQFLPDLPDLLSGVV